MKIAGEALLNAPVERVWDALLDPAVLVRTIPGCERLTATGDNRYDMTVTAGVAAIRGTYAGTCELRDLHRHESLVMTVQGAGAPGTISADVAVRFEEREDGPQVSTLVSYDTDAVVGGMLGGVGQRMLGSVSKRMAAEFFGAVDQALSDPEPAGATTQSGTFAPTSDRAMPGVYVDAPRPGSSGEFLKGIAVGAALVLLGVVAGRLGSRPT